MSDFDITKAPDAELLIDLAESIADIKICELALLHSIETYSGGRVAERLEGNRNIVEMIEAELSRRARAYELVG